ncbi:MAG: AraC family transcriptional regulator [Cyanobacteria bacterium P01_F01_bin.153]
MTLLLSMPEFWSQNPEIAATAQKVRQPWTMPLKNASGKGQGYRQSINLRPGLNILIDDFTLQEDLLIEKGARLTHAPRFCLEMSFMLSANNLKEGIPAHHNFLDAYWEEEVGGIFTWQQGDHILKLDIHFDQDLFNSLLCDQLETLPDSLANVAKSSRPGQSDWCFRQLSATTPAMQSALHQMLHCPYQGPARWIYWESKVLELLALRLEEVRQPDQRAIAKPKLKPDDLDRIHYARDILHQRIADPPSLLELSRLAGLNDYKLKVGFKQLFGTTVFAHLKRHRLEQARRLLQERQISIAAAAEAVGYTSHGHFAAAFRKQFGIYPREVHQ